MRLLAIFTLVCSSMFGAIVQENGFGGVFSAPTPQTLTVAAGANGHVLIGWFSTSTAATNGIVALTQTNVTWTVSKAFQDNVASSVGLEMWTGVIAGGASGTTITAVLANANPLGFQWEVSEYTGCTTAMDGFGNGHSNGVVGTAVNSNGVTQLTTAFANDCIFAAVATGANIMAPTVMPVGYTALSFASDNFAGGQQENYLLTNSAGNQSPTWTLGTSSQWASLVVALKATAAVVAAPIGLIFQ